MGECAAIAWVCKIFNKDFIKIAAITDKIGEPGTGDQFMANMGEARRALAEAVVHYISFTDGQKKAYARGTWVCGRCSSPRNSYKNATCTKCEGPYNYDTCASGRMCKAMRPNRRPRCLATTSTQFESTRVPPVLEDLMHKINTQRVAHGEPPLA